MTPKNINPQQNNTADFTTEQEHNSTSLGQQWAKLNLNNNNNRKPNLLEQKRSSQVLLEAYVEDEDLAELSTTTTTTTTSSSFRTKSLTDEDLEELKGCVDLGFGFSYDEIPELCNTLPALELCYSMSQRFMDHELQRSSGGGGDNVLSTESESDSSSLSSSPVANWKISSPGDHPEDVKARLKYWAQAVACTVKLCS